MPLLLLRSPLHVLLSDKLMLLTFTGRRSGRRYTTPVVVVRRGDDLLLTTDSPWWRNLRGGAPVTMRLSGRELNGIAWACDDPAATRKVLTEMLAGHPSYGKRIGCPPGPTGRSTSTRRYAPAAWESG